MIFTLYTERFGEVGGEADNEVMVVRYYPVKVEFWQESGACITNTISDGPGMGEEEMNMTYTFEW